MRKTTIKTYSECIQLLTYEQRLNYLLTHSTIGAESFGGSRYLNQRLYTSPKWKRFRREIIIRDKGCDLAIEEMEILGVLCVHHINPLTKEQVLKDDYCIYDPENAICADGNTTHRCIHFSDVPRNIKPVERTKYDTAPWRL